MNQSAKAEFFDGIADRWDGWEDLAVLHQRLTGGLAELGVAAGERIMDVGCGTGNLTRALLQRLSADGRVVAVDLSRRMIALAEAKIQDSRVAWHCGDACKLSFPEDSFDRLICCSVWPHFDDHRAATAVFFRLLKPGGWLHIWHLLSRDRVNEIHAGAGEAVKGDHLPAGEETAELLAASGFSVTGVVDDAERYLVTARKPGA